MKIVIFGLTISSSWGNGHATLWRALCRALAGRGHRVVFFERDVSYYAAHRDRLYPDGCDLRLYGEWTSVVREAERTLRDADAAMVTSYCPDGAAASGLVLESPARAKVFYDLDTPVTLERLAHGEEVPYLPPGGLGDFDLVLSYTGGRALDELQRRLHARAVAPLYGSVDPDAHHPVAPHPAFSADLSYIGTYAEDRQAALEELMLKPARVRPDRRFVIAGSQYPQHFPWGSNIYYVSHLPPADHPAFYCSSALTLNITRGPMATMGYCPSGRLFEAAACGTPILSDWWEGLDAFFEPGREILVAATADEALHAIDMRGGDRAAIGRAARERTLACHTAQVRAAELEVLLERASSANSGSSIGLEVA
ncbi:MAG TPA: glycosyltransferase [Vicinamibacterales bacterium]|nr:glycosyltransferase [Vicinamibacterales bacterium]